MPTGDTLRPAPAPCGGTSGFDPSTALTALDGLVGGRAGPEAASAWDAAWIACVTGSPRWAETAQREFARATARPGVRAV